MRVDSTVATAHQERLVTSLVQIGDAESGWLAPCIGEHVYSTDVTVCMPLK